MKTDIRLVELWNSLSGENVTELPELFWVQVSITDKVTEDLKVRQINGCLLQCIDEDSQYHLYVISTQDVVLWFPEIRD